VKYPELKAEYTDYEAKRGAARCPKAFEGCRFAVGLLNPMWCQYMDFIPRFFGNDWEKHFKNLLFRLQMNDNDMWLPGSRNGPLAKEFLGKLNLFIIPRKFFPL